MHLTVCVSSAEDAFQAVNYGVDGILVSNHGARQLDGVPATVCKHMCVCALLLNKILGVCYPYLT